MSTVNYNELVIPCDENMGGTSENSNDQDNKDGKGKDKGKDKDKGELKPPVVLPGIGGLSLDREESEE